MTSRIKLGSVVGSVIQANGMLSFEDDLMSGPGLAILILMCERALLSCLELN